MNNCFVRKIEIYYEEQKKVINYNPWEATWHGSA